MKKVKIKNGVIGLLSLMFGLLTVSVTASAAEPVSCVVDGLTYEINEEDHTAVLTKGSTAASIDIPETILYNGGTYEVTTIGNSAFEYSTATSITLPDTLTTIEDSAFVYCYYVEELDIPDSVTYIGKNAFWRCEALEEIHIPSGITEISEGAFGYLNKVTELTIPSNITVIGKNGFVGLGYTSGAEIHITIPKNVTYVGYEAFARTEAIKSVTIEAGREENLQLDGAFRVCDGLESVEILSGNVTIGNNDFQLCPILKNVTLADGITTIGNYAFSSAPYLQKVEFPSTVTSLGMGVLYNSSEAVAYYPSSVELPYLALKGIKTKVAYSVNSDGKTVTIDSVTETPLEKTPETICGMKISAVPDEYKDEEKHFHYYGEENSQVYCSICEQLNPNHIHIWNTPVWKWEDDYSKATAVFSCTGGAGHEEEVTAEITSRTTPADCTKEGETVYTASILFEGKTYSDIKVQVIPAKGHTFKWIIDKEAEETKAGLKHEECTICGYKKAAVEIPAVGAVESTVKNDKTNSSAVPSTGDDSSIFLWGCVAAAAGSALVGIVIYRKKRKVQ